MGRSAFAARATWVTAMLVLTAALTLRMEGDERPANGQAAAQQVKRLPRITSERTEAPPSDTSPDRPEPLSLKRLPPIRLPSVDVSDAPPAVASSGAERSDPSPDELEEGARWWHDQVTKPVRGQGAPRYIDLNTLLLAALQHSPRVQAINEEPLIRETAILEAAAEFDPESFLESKYVSLSDPVGNTLTTGGPSRFRQQDYQLSAGMRKKTSTGGTLEFAQKIGKLHNNSVFFVPAQQGNARLSLSFTQPMLRRAGQVYNNSLVVLAQLDTQIAANEAAAQLQDHLLEVTRAYQALQLHRAILAQKRRLATRGEAILQELEARQDLDAMQSQIARARSAVVTRRAQLVRAEAEVLNAETRIRALVQSPELIEDELVELVPVSLDLPQPMNIAVGDAFVTALYHRPEIDQAMKQTRAAQVRTELAASDVLPSLDFVLETYVAGLAPNFQTGNAFTDQFTNGQPGFTAGFEFESPWGSRAAEARLKRRQLEFRQLTNQFRDTLATLKAEVEIAVRQVETAQREMEALEQAIKAAELDITFMEERWRHLPGDEGSRGLLLEDLLRAQERLATSEHDFSSAQLRFATAVAELKRSTGTLFRHEQVEGPSKGAQPGEAK